MDVKIIFYIILALILLLSVTFAVIWIIRKRNSRRKVCEMQMSQKVRLLNGLTEPSGFIYDTHWDVFTSRTDAWQRKFGYEMLFDRIAAGVNMVLDTWPVYFDYEGRTWLIEFWKGQYGINTGAETGIYHADHLNRRDKLTYQLCHLHFCLCRCAEAESPAAGLGHALPYCRMVMPEDHRPP